MGGANNLKDLPGHLAASAVVNQVRPAVKINLMTIDPTYKHRPIETSPIINDSKSEEGKKQTRTNIMVYYASRTAKDLFNTENFDKTDDGISDIFSSLLEKNKLYDQILSPEYEMSSMLSIAVGKYAKDYGLPNNHEELEEIFGNTETDMTMYTGAANFPDNERDIKDLMAKRAVFEAKRIIEQNHNTVNNIHSELISEQSINGNRLSEIISSSYPCILRPDNEPDL